MNTESVLFISCEDQRQPVYGVFNFYASLSSVPLLYVPLSSLLTAVPLVDVKKRSPFIHTTLIAWLLTLTVLFLTNLFQHVLGGHRSIQLHELLGAVQGLWHSCLLNALRRKNGWRSINERAGLTIAFVATAAVFSASCSLGTDAHEAVVGIVSGFTGIFIVASHGALSWRDERAWRLFLRSCVGLLLVLTLTGPHGLEKKLCDLRASIGYHAIVDHACIVCLFGGVTQNAVHLVDRVVTKQCDEKKYN